MSHQPTNTPLKSPITMKEPKPNPKQRRTDAQPEHCTPSAPCIEHTNGTTGEQNETTRRQNEEVHQGLAQLNRDHQAKDQVRAPRLSPHWILDPFIQFSLSRPFSLSCRCRRWVLAGRHRWRALENMEDNGMCYMCFSLFSCWTPSNGQEKTIFLGSTVPVGRKQVKYDLPLIYVQNAAPS